MKARRSSGTRQNSPDLRAITLLTVEQVATVLGVHRDTVWHWRRTGELPPPIRIGPQTVRWVLADIEAYIERKKQEAGNARPVQELRR